MFSFGHCPNYLSPPPPPLLSGNLYIFFGRQKLIYILCFFNSGRGLPPPHSGNARKKTFFFREVFPYGDTKLFLFGGSNLILQNFWGYLSLSKFEVKVKYQLRATLKMCIQRLSQGNGKVEQYSLKLELEMKLFLPDHHFDCKTDGGGVGRWKE